MLLSGTESWNLPRLFRKKQHVEVYSFRFVDSRQKVALWYCQEVLIIPDQEPEASLRIVLYDLERPENTRVLSKTVPLKETRIEPDIFYFSVAGGEMYHKGSHGCLELPEGNLEWQLQWKPSDKGFRYLPLRSLYKLNGPWVKIVAPNPEIQVTGWIHWGERSYEFEGVPAYQLHQWGPHTPETWSFGQVDQFENYVRTSFEGLSYRFGKDRGHTPMFSQFRIVISGKEYRINKPWQWHRNLIQGHADRWHFEVTQYRNRFIGDVFVEPKHLVGIKLKSSDGSDRYCYRTENARLRLQHYQKKRGDWILERELKSLPAMAYEFGTSEVLAGVPLARVSS
jgi:hypothetical protein